MLELDIEYSDFLCKTALTMNNHLSNFYKDYLIINKPINSYPKIVDYEHNEFLLNLIESAEEWTDIETAMQNDMKIINYKRLPELIRYMYGMDYLTESIHKGMKGKIAIPQLSDFSLEDSEINSLVIHSVEDTCSLVLSNVLVYNNSRLDNAVDVNVNTINITFLNVNSLHINGSIDTKTKGMNYIYKCYSSIIDNQMYQFDLFALSNKNKFLFSIQCSNIEVAII